MNKLDIIIPVYNEGESILKLLDDMKKNIKYEHHILICFDNYNDTTLLYLKNKNFKNIKLIKNPEIGPNTAILEGIRQSDAEIILVYMADDYENIKLINNMVEMIEVGYDLIIPSRFIRGGIFKGASFLKKYVTIFGSISIYYFAALPFRDCTNAFKMFNNKVKEKVIFKSKYGFTYAFEMSLKSYLLDLKIKEIPSKWIENNLRKSNFKVLTWLPHYLYFLLISFLLIKIKKIKKLFY